MRLLMKNVLDRPRKPQIEPSTTDTASERLPKDAPSPRARAGVFLRLLPQGFDSGAAGEMC